MMGDIKRRLAAILAADVAGYTKHMADDAAATVSALDSCRLVFREHIEGQGGRVVDMAGDSVLAVFETATGATEAALAVQKALAGRDMQFRIGIHLGEVIEKPDGTVYGDGVNLAARLEGLAAPGGVCISAAVSDQVSGKIDDAFEDIGQHEVKNVPKPVHAFAWGGGAAPGLAQGRKPAVALGEFGGGETAADLAAAVRDAIAASLSNQTGLTLVSDPAKADYLAEAAIQVRGARYRATLTLLDRGSGETFASDRFDGANDDPFEIEDDLGRRLYSAIRFAIMAHEIERAKSRNDGASDAQTLLLKAGQRLFDNDAGGYLEARAMLDSLLAREPENFTALAMKAHSHLHEPFCGYRTVAEDDAKAAFEAASRAVQLNENSDFARVVLGSVYVFAMADPAAAKRETERALELNPYYSFAMHALGGILMCQGAIDDGLAHCRQALESSPRAPNTHWVLRDIAIGNFAAGRYAEAMEYAEQAEQRRAGQPRALASLAAAAALTGEATKAQDAAARLLAHSPDFRIRDYGDWPFQDPGPAERLVEGLRLAGLPQ
jgi:adenylate cyclase